jgi:c-di-GMP phosphodiesterase
VGQVLDSAQFELYYQPEVECLNKVVGVEVLLRWNDPALEQLTSDEFLPMIENDRPAFRIGCWVMQQALRGRLYGCRC